MEALGAAGSIVGIVSFGLQLAVTLQTHVEAVSEATERLHEIALDVHSTSAAMKQLSDMMEKDAEAPNKLFKDAALHDLTVLSKQCDRVYKTIVFLLNKAKNGDEKGKAPAVKKIDSINIASLSGKLGLGRSLKWPWLEPHIRRCQEQLRQHKMNLLIMLHLSTLAQFQAQHSDGQADSDAEAEEKNLQAVALELKKKQQEARVIIKEIKDNGKEDPNSEDVSVHDQSPPTAMIAMHAAVPEPRALNVKGIIGRDAADGATEKHSDTDQDDAPRELEPQAVPDQVASPVKDDGSWDAWLGPSKAEKKRIAKKRERHRRWAANAADVFSGGDEKDRSPAPPTEPEATPLPPPPIEKDIAVVESRQTNLFSPVPKEKNNAHVKPAGSIPSGHNSQLPKKQDNPDSKRGSDVLSTFNSQTTSAERSGSSISRLYHRAVDAVAGGSMKSPWRRKPRQRLEAFFLEIQMGATYGVTPPKLELSQDELEAKFKRLFREKKNGESLLEPYWIMGGALRTNVDNAIGSVRRSGTEARTLVAITVVDGPFSLASMHQTGYYGGAQRALSMLMFFRVGAEVEPVTFADEKGREHLVPYEHCRSYKLALSALGLTSTTTAQPVFEVGERRILPFSWDSVVKPGSTIKFLSTAQTAPEFGAPVHDPWLSSGVDWFSPADAVEWPTQGNQPPVFHLPPPPPRMSQNVGTGPPPLAATFIPPHTPDEGITVIDASRKQSQGRSSELVPSDSGETRPPTTASDPETEYFGYTNYPPPKAKRKVRQAYEGRRGSGSPDGEITRRAEKRQGIREHEMKKKELEMKMRELEEREKVELAKKEGEASQSEMRKQEKAEWEARAQRMKERELREDKNREMKELELREREMRRREIKKQEVGDEKMREGETVVRHLVEFGMSKREQEMMEREMAEQELKELEMRKRQKEEQTTAIEIINRRDSGSESPTSLSKIRRRARSDTTTPPTENELQGMLDEDVELDMAPTDSHRIDEPDSPILLVDAPAPARRRGRRKPSWLSTGSSKEGDGDGSRSLDLELEEVIGGSTDDSIENELLNLNMDELVERWTNKAPRSESKSAGDGLPEPNPR